MEEMDTSVSDRPVFSLPHWCPGRIRTYNMVFSCSSETSADLQQGDINLSPDMRSEAQIHILHTNTSKSREKIYKRTIMQIQRFPLTHICTHSLSHPLPVFIQWFVPRWPGTRSRDSQIPSSHPLYQGFHSLQLGLSSLLKLLCASLSGEGAL